MLLADLGDVIVYLILLEAIALIAWIGQWGRVNKIARYFTQILMGVSAFIFLVLAVILWFARSFLPIQNMGSGITIFAGLFAVWGILGIVSLIKPLRRILSKTIFSGLEVDTPAHTWALYIFLSAIVFSIYSITVFYNPKVIIESLKSLPLSMMACINAMSFLLFSFIAAGVFIYKPFKQTAADLGLTKISWKTFRTLLLVAACLCVGIQGLEWFLMFFVSPHTRFILGKIMHAMQPTQTSIGTLLTAMVVGITAGAGEETLFRGLMQPVFGVIPTAFLFMLIHSHYGPTILLVELFIIGLVLGMIRKKWNTTASIVVHSCFDFLALVSPLIHHF